LTEQHLPLVREVAEERALRHPGTFGDLDHGRVLVALRREQVEGGDHEPL
jgi:hypothetical protein